MTDDNLPDVAALIAEARNGYRGQEWVKDLHPRSMVGLALRLTDALESLSARVTQAETELAQANHQAWAEGHAAPADSGRWINDKPRKGLRQWQPVPTPNPYPNHSSPGTGKEGESNG